MDYIESLPTYREDAPYSRDIYRAPYTQQMAKFLGRFFSRSALAKLSNRFSGPKQPQ